MEAESKEIEVGPLYKNRGEKCVSGGELGGRKKGDKDSGSFNITVASTKGSTSFSLPSRMKMPFLVSLLALVLILILGVDVTDLKKIVSSSDQNSATKNTVSADKKYNRVKWRQIQSYIDGTGLILSVHVTHHGGTYLCGQMKAIGKTPKFACMAGHLRENDPTNWPYNNTIVGDKEWKIRYSNTWPANETGIMTKELRKYFHMISWEFDTRWGHLSDTDWEHPDLLSVVIMRDPLERFMAGGKCGKFKKAIRKDLADDPTPSMNDLYWQYANDKCADNFALRIFTGSPGCCDGANTDVQYLEQAKRQMDRTTVLIDQTCETESIKALFELLKIDPNITNVKRKPEKARRLSPSHPPVRERLGNDTLYEYLQEKFNLDIELYKYAQAKSILDCSKVKKR
jgi:hypothetical protein